MKKNKKLLTALGSLTLCAALCMGVAGCSNTGKKDADNKTATTTANDVYATSAVSSAAYLNTLGGAGSVNGSFNADGNTELPTGYLYQNMTEIKNNIVLFEKLVSSNIKEKIDTKEVDRRVRFRQWKMTFSESTQQKNKPCKGLVFCFGKNYKKLLQNLLTLSELQGV